MQLLFYLQHGHFIASRLLETGRSQVRILLARHRKGLFNAAPFLFAAWTLHRVPAHRDGKVAGSNPATPTKKRSCLKQLLFYLQQGRFIASRLIETGRSQVRILLARQRKGLFNAAPFLFAARTLHRVPAPGDGKVAGSNPATPTQKRSCLKQLLFYLQHGLFIASRLLETGRSQVRILLARQRKGLFNAAPFLFAAWTLHRVPAPGDGKVAGSNPASPTQKRFV